MHCIAYLGRLRQAATGASATSPSVDDDDDDRLPPGDYRWPGDGRVYRIALRGPSVPWTIVADEPALRASDLQELLEDLEESEDTQFSLRSIHPSHEPEPVLAVFIRTLQPSEEFSGNWAVQRRLTHRFFSSGPDNCYEDNSNFDWNLGNDDERINAAIDALKEDYQRGHSYSTDQHVRQLYGQLSVAHGATDAERVPAAVTDATQSHVCAALRPRLRPYQQQAVNWMLDRERGVHHLPSEAVPLKWASHGGGLLQRTQLYGNYRTCSLYAAAGATPIPLPSGGILADEMGLGKTVEMLALIVANRRPNELEVRQPSVAADRGRIALQPVNVWCVCGQTNTTSNKRRKQRTDDANAAEPPPSLLLRCTDCGLHQHRDCVQRHRTPPAIADPPAAYKCPECWQAAMRSDTAAPIASAATVIVSPPAIRQQWLQEIHKHIETSAGFHVLVYAGIKQTGWISPSELARYDLILCDYNVLRTELHFMDANRRACRAECRPRFMPLRTALPLVRWWRVCLDEAQLVERTGGNAAQMVRRLPAHHRWAITGTPLENDINSLFGFVHFLGVQPYTAAPDMWRQLTEGWTRGGPPKRLVRLLQRFMWRTCKRDVWQSIGIPDQTERTHYVRMTDVQAFYYADRHRASAQRFDEVLARMLADGSVRGERTSLMQMNVSTLKRLMEPLRKLRQDCTVPSLMDGDGGGGGGGGVSTTAAVDYRDVPMGGFGRRLLSPAELHRHLVARHEVACKTRLRTLASTLNSVAGLHAVCADYAVAGERYERVLRLAQQYSSGGAVSVDSVLQMHALHNLLEIFELSAAAARGHSDDTTITIKSLATADAATKAEYNAQLLRLQAHFMARQVADLAAGHEQVMAARAAVLQAHVQPGLWTQSGQTAPTNWLLGWQLDADDLASFTMLAKATLPEHQSRQLCDSVVGIKRLLKQWFERRAEQRTAIVAVFERLDRVAQMMRRMAELSVAETAELEAFIAKATECHLLRDRVKRNPCESCRLKEALTRYECELYDKKLVAPGAAHRFGRLRAGQGGAGDEDEVDGDATAEDVNVGSLNPPMQENLLKLLCNFLAPSRAPHVQPLLELGRQHLGAMQTLKAEQRGYSAYWVAFRNACNSTDELQQCKLRFRSYDQLPSLPDDAELWRINRHHQITRDPLEARGQLPELERDMEADQRRLEHECGTLKYLQRLQRDHGAGSAVVEECPICDALPKSRYAVLLCGHHVCIGCLGQMQKTSHSRQVWKAVIRCSVCRQQQLSKDIFYVQCDDDQTDPEANAIPIVGEYSPKVTAIVRCLLQLRQDDAGVKVLIFSHWDAILALVAGALRANGVRVCCRSQPFHRSVDEFRSEDVTALLLPLSCGSKGLNLVEATHVFLVEPILDVAEELQAIGRVHRIGQTKPTTVHRFIVSRTIEETIFNTIAEDTAGKWKANMVSIEHLSGLFRDVD